MTANGTPARKTEPSDWEKACTTPLWIAAGSLSRTCGLALPMPPESPPRWNPLGRSVTSLAISTLLKMAPKIGTPMEPPMERKKVAVEVATPMSFWVTLFCTTTTRTCMTPPRPRPSTTM